MAALFAGTGQHVAHKVHAAALPARARTAQTTPVQLPQELDPECLGSLRSRHPSRALRDAITVDADGNDGGSRDDATVLAHFEVGSHRGTDRAGRPPGGD